MKWIRILALALLASPAWSQVCDQSFTLRTTACPAGALDCTSKGSELSHAEGDDNFINIVDLCNAFDVGGADVTFEGDLAFGGLVRFGAGTAFPSGPAAGDIFLVTDDANSGDCTSGGGSAVSLCIYDGAGWEAFVTGYGAEGTFGDITIGSNAFNLEADSVDTAEIADDAVTPDKILSTGKTDEYCVTYEATGDTWEYQSCNPATSETDPTLTDDAAVTICAGGGADCVLTFAESGTDGTLTWDYTNDEFDASGPITTPATTTPTLELDDSDSASESPDAQLFINATNTTDAQEDVDFTLQTVVDGSMTSVLAWDADGATADAQFTVPDDSIGPDEVLATGQTDGYALVYEATGDTWAWTALAGGGDVTDVWNCSTADCNTPTIESGEYLDGGTATVDSTSEGILLPRGASCTGATSEGQLCWDTDDDDLYVGDGATANIVSGAASGSDTQVQFNDGGTAFGGDAGLTYNKTTDTLTVGTAAADGLVQGPGSTYDLHIDANGENITLGDGGSTNYIQITDGGVLSFTGTANISVLALAPTASAPTCGASQEGHVYADDSGALCYCDGSSWSVAAGGGSCT